MIESSIYWLDLESLRFKRQMIPLASGEMIDLEYQQVLEEVDRIAQSRNLMEFH